MNVLSLEKRAEVVRLVLSGYTVRKAARVVGSANMTCHAFVTRVGASCQGMLVDRMRNTPVYDSALRRAAFVVRGAFVGDDRGASWRTAVALLDERSGAVAGFGLGKNEAEAASDARCAVERQLGAAIAVDDLPSTLPAPAPRRARLQAKDETFVRNILAIWFCYRNLCEVSESGKTPAQAAGAAHDRWTIRRLVATAIGLSIEAESPPGITNELEAWTEPGAAPANGTEKPKKERGRLYQFRDESLTIRQIAERTGKNVDFLRDQLKRGIFPEDAVRDRYEKLIGAHFDRMEVLAVEGEPGTDRQCYCRCRCGAEKWASLKHLKARRVKSCGCAHLEELSNGEAPTHVELLGERLSIGQLAVLAGCRPVSIWARLRRGMTVEEAAFGRKDLADA